MLPALREELALFPSANSADGSPNWSLHDPVRNLFFRIDWLAFEILSRWHLDEPEAILSEIAERTAIEPEPDDIAAIVEFLANNQLLQQHSREGSAALGEMSARAQLGWWRWLLHHYLFFRVPLWNPDGFLNRWAPRAGFLYSRHFLLLTLLALVAGLVLVSRQWDTFVVTVVDTFSLSTLLGFAVTLALVKFVHELGHAFTAKRMGCHVPTIGVAFLVLLPLAYTDVNDSWKLPRRRQRLAVGGAGILVELVIAAWATLAWALLPDGMARDAAFLLASTTWISTLLINASPFLRFDGYFLLMDWLEMPNLHQRAFALGRWQLRKALFAIGDDPPEALSRRRHAGIVGFAYLVWVYRAIVFAGIAVVVYQVFPKPLGPFLAAVEVAWFLFMPLWREMSNWPGLAFGGLLRRGGLRWLILFGLVLALLLLPWDQRIGAQGILKPVSYFNVVSPGGSRIVALQQDAARVQPEQLVARLEAAELQARQQQASLRTEAQRWQAVAASLDPGQQRQQPLIAADRDRLQAELTSVEDEIRRYDLPSPLAGRFFMADPDLRRGDWVGENEPIGVLVDPTVWQVETYMTELALARIRLGDSARFYAETPGLPVLDLRVRHIDRDATHVLHEPMLSSLHGGQLVVRDGREGPVPETAHYRVILAVSAPYVPEVPQVMRGQVVIFGEARSLATDFLRSVAAVVVREAGF